MKRDRKYDEMTPGQVPMQSAFSATLIPQAREALKRELSHRDGLRWAYLYGSAARGEEFADLDVAIMPGPSSFKSLLDTGMLGAELARELGLEGLTVDVIDLRTATLPFLATMLDEAVVLLDREPAARRFWEVEKTLRWLDFEPLWSMCEKLRRRQLREGAWSTPSEPAWGCLGGQVLSLDTWKDMWLK